MNKKVTIILLIIFALLAGGMYGGYLYLDSQISIDGYYNGIFVGGIDIGGLNRNQAEEILKSSLEKDFESKGVHIKSPEHKGEETFLSYVKLGYTYDYDKALSEAYLIGRDGTIIDRFMKIKELETNPVNIDIEPFFSESKLDDEIMSISEKYIRKPKDAEFEFNNGEVKVTQHVNGTDVDTASLKKDIVGVMDGGGTIELPLKVVEPDIKSDFYEKINGKIGEFSTSFKGSALGRVNNIRLSAGAFKGILLLPGEELSYNETTGPRMASSGYQEAPVIVNGELTPGMGGGVCQTSTTLYNALLLADLEIVERSPHSIAPAYVPRGTDGAVATGYLDLRFRNNFDYPIYIDTEVIGTRVYFYIYGDLKSRDYSVKIETQLNATIPYKVHENLDPSLPPGSRELVQEGRTGYKVSTFKSIIKNGEVVSKEKISSDYYRERDFIYKVGPAVVAPTPVIEPIVEVEQPEPEQPVENVEPEVLP